MGCTPISTMSVLASVSTPLAKADMAHQHQSHPDAVYVRSIPGRSAHLDPMKIPRAEVEDKLNLMACL
eukprot:1147769-Pelagomonas_calceolata.AAC.3